MHAAFHLEIEAGDEVAAAAGALALVAAEKLPEKETLAAFRRALRLDPSEPDYRYILGSALMRLGRHAEAVTALREAVAFQPGHAIYRRTLGAALWRLGRHAEAVDVFQQVLSEAPRDVDALNGLGLALLDLGDVRRAENALGRAHALARRRPDLRSNHAAALWAAGRAVQAERQFRLAVEASPAHVPFRRNLGYALLGLGRPAEAVERFREALRHAPEDASLFFDLGDACFTAGHADAAEQAWEQGALLDPALAALRTGSREARQALALERLRGELEAERTRSREGGLGAGLLRRIDALRERVARAPGRLGHSVPSRLGAVALFALVVLGLRAAFVVTPHYVAHFQLRDDVAQACRTATKDDSLVRERVMGAVHERGRGPFVDAAAIMINTRGRLRRVELAYTVPVEVLPGWRPALRFHIRVEELVLAEPDPVFL